MRVFSSREERASRPRSTRVARQDRTCDGRKGGKEGRREGGREGKEVSDHGSFEGLQKMIVTASLDKLDDPRLTPPSLPPSPPPSFTLLTLATTRSSTSTRAVSMHGRMNCRHGQEGN